MSRRLQVVLGLLLAVGFTVLFLRQADLTEVGREIAEAKAGWLWVAVAMTFVTMLQRARRWQSMLHPVGHLPVTRLLTCTLMGWSVTTLLPGRLGEVVRPVLAARGTEVPAAAALGSVVLERVLDALTVLVILALYLSFLPPPTELGDEGRAVMATLRTTGLIGLAMGVAGLSVAMAMLRGQRTGGLLQRVLGWLPERIAAALRTFLFGLASLRQPSRLLGILVQSLALWVAIGAIYWVMFQSLDVRLPWYAVPTLLALVVVGVAVPTPGGVGSFHKAAQVGLVSLWGVDNDLAVAYAILSHAVTFLPTALVGVVLLVREGVSWRSLEEIRAPEPQESPGATV